MTPEQLEIGKQYEGFNPRAPFREILDIYTENGPLMPLYGRVSVLYIIGHDNPKHRGLITSEHLCSIEAFCRWAKCLT